MKKLGDAPFADVRKAFTNWLRMDYLEHSILLCWWSLTENSVFRMVNGNIQLLSLVESKIMLMFHRKVLVVLICLSISVISTYAQVTERPILIGNVKTDINNLLPAGAIVVDIFTGVKQSPKQAELMEKVKQGVQKNYDWFVDYSKEHADLKPLPYHVNLGVTEAEYKEMLSGMKEMEQTSSGTESVTILKEGNKITFKNSGKLKVLEAVSFDIETNTVKLGNSVLQFDGNTDVTSDDNALKSKWKGFNWKLEEPNDLDPAQFKDLKNLTAKFYKVTLGRLEKNGKTLLQLQGKEFVKGEMRVNFDIPLIF